MFYKLLLKQQEELKSLPETGMGYQLISARYYGEYSKHELLVLNGEIIVENNDLGYKYLNGIFSKGFNLSVRSAPYRELQDITLMKNIGSFNVFEDSPDKFSAAKDSHVTNPDGKTYYVRLSAYDDDKRIDKKNNCLLPGSYSTTKKDYEQCVNDKDDPVERYALPNPEKIKWAFHILPQKKDSYRFGKVQSAFGKSGGGEECFFENGTSFSTFKKQTDYGIFHP